MLSDFLHCEVGVPQGSNLGPLFFIIFFNDLPYELESEVDSYADDTTISATGGSVREIGEKLTADCSKVSHWMRSNKLKLNPDKTHILTMGTQQRLNTLPENISVTMDDVVLEEDPAKCELLLGCQMAANLKWHQQVSRLLEKLRTRLTGLAHLKFICPFNIRKTITEGLFNSVMVYCLPLFGGMDKGQLRDVQVLQNKAARIVCHAPPRTSRIILFQKLSVNQLISYHTLLSVFKIRSSKEPEYLAQFLDNDNRNDKIIVTNTELSLAKNATTLQKL